MITENMESVFKYNYEHVVSLVALLIALISLFVSYMAMRYQIIGLLTSQIADKAKECNSYLEQQNLSLTPTKIDRISGILSAIITCEELINYEVYYKGSIFLCNLKVEYLVDKFYLQLHTTIRVFIAQNELTKAEHINKIQMETLEEQFKRAQTFMKLSIVKNQKKEFERLKEYSVGNNKNTPN